MTTYIESKLNPDGRTYDHSEVIAAVRNGAHLDFLHPTIEEWEPIGDPTWACYIKYRAVIEDKQDQIVDEIIDAILYEEKLSILIRDRFHSEPVNIGGRMVNVDHIILTRAEVNKVFPGLLK